MQENQPTPAENNDDQEWAAASEQFSLDKGINPGAPEKVEKPVEEPKKAEPVAPEKKVEEPAKPEEKKEPEAPKPPENETPEEKTAREAKEAEEAKRVEEVEIPDNPGVREARATQREIAEDRKAMAQDIKEKMFAEVQTELTDSDGDPIRTPADVMKLINPNTQKAFTAEEATAYLFAAQRNLDKQLETTEKQIEEITDTMLTLKDDSDSIKIKYGPILQGLPGLRDELWTEYKKTLTVDEKTGIVTKAPISLAKFYEVALKPYAAMAVRIQKEQEAEAVETKKATEQTRKNTQSDRTDIYGGGKTDTMDAEEKEWADVAKAHYER